ncbi:30S ribosomal protein S8 [Candidatus Collierbacteria bacterium CG10_big_fil_rev_8_21_14_0_10_44_9]|uniref:Small ribosomal subunit protein uS8 n=1 Tax=Candidatus Collierbacteria bacterium CG10_big_fil_rev_8_21_14_0_10_44_9 TaxID=1974535 RepID=A0A2H0VJK7_9BACT|nr:MAG: 30S ribosomal protein S8 [Candidatus Collierbacteria bacterium CG10_big_fil_rev_8_21_14_0_10_44_9]
MINDHISDMITRIKNTYSMHKKIVMMPYTKVLASVAKVMLDEKYLSDVKVEGTKVTDKKLFLTLSYKSDTAAISAIKRISKPGVRIYRHVNDFKPVLSGLGIAILSTQKGIMSDRNAKINKIGGEVLLELW